MIELYTAIIAADKIKSYKALCGEYTRAAICYLIESISRAGIDVWIEQLFIKDQIGRNHTFIVIGRATPPNRTPIKTAHQQPSLSPKP